MTSLAEEREAQRPWTARLRDPDSDYFSRLVEHEFIAPQQHLAWQGRQLQRLVCFAATNVSYYTRLFERLGEQAEDIRGVDDLSRLPMLAMDELVDQPDALTARTLPDGERVFGRFTSSGTTGRPKRLLMTVAANNMFSNLAQRLARWGRFDPSDSVAVIRDAVALPRDPQGKLLANGQTWRNPQWRYLGRFFHTGESLAYSYSNPTEDQVRWLREMRANYLISYPTALEELALACPGDSRVESIRGLQSISGELRDAMRERIESAFGVRVHQDYGLNEVGIVAGRCEAGRYHVNTEHCIVEIVDEDLRPCDPGQVGRILVTALSNLATPLIRYDTDDMAEQLAAPCPCGRTSPTFGRIFGRFRRWSVLPPGTREHFYALGDTTVRLPSQLLEGISRYQVHQDERGDLELRLVMRGELPPRFDQELNRLWIQRVGASPKLRVRVVESIPVGPGGKPQEFTSALEPGATRL